MQGKAEIMSSAAVAATSATRFALQQTTHCFALKSLQRQTTTLKKATCQLTIKNNAKLTFFVTISIAIVLLSSSDHYLPNYPMYAAASPISTKTTDNHHQYDQDSILAEGSGAGPYLSSTKNSETAGDTENNNDDDDEDSDEEDYDDGNSKPIELLTTHINSNKSNNYTSDSVFANTSHTSKISNISLNITKRPYSNIADFIPVTDPSNKPAAAITASPTYAPSSTFDPSLAPALLPKPTNVITNSSIGIQKNQQEKPTEDDNSESYDYDDGLEEDEDSEDSSNFEDNVPDSDGKELPVTELTLKPSNSTATLFKPTITTSKPLSTTTQLLTSTPINKFSGDPSNIESRLNFSTTIGVPNLTTPSPALVLPTQTINQKGLVEIDKDYDEDDEDDDDDEDEFEDGNDRQPPVVQDVKLNQNTTGIKISSNTPTKIELVPTTTTTTTTTTIVPATGISTTKYVTSTQATTIRTTTHVPLIPVIPTTTIAPILTMTESSTINIAAITTKVIPTNPPPSTTARNFYDMIPIDFPTVTTHLPDYPSLVTIRYQVPTKTTSHPSITKYQDKQDVPVAGKNPQNVLYEYNLTREILDGTVNFAKTISKATQSAIDAIWPTIDSTSAWLEPVFAQPLLFMLAMGGGVIALVLMMLLIVYIVTYQIQPPPREDDYSDYY